MNNPTQVAAVSTAVGFVADQSVMWVVWVTVGVTVGDESGAL